MQALPATQGSSDRSEQNGQNKPAILIADDHRLVAEVVSDFIVSSGEFTVDLASTLEEALQKLSVSAYDIVMLDLIMPGMTGTEGISKVVTAAADGSVVLFASRVDRFTLDRSLELGVKGIIPKSMPSRSIISALRLVHSGEIFLPASTIDNRLSHDKKADALNETELFILRLASQGYTNKQIANDIGQNETSIKMFMRAICIKLNARNRAHASMIGRDLGLLSD